RCPRCGGAGHTNHKKVDCGATRTASRQGNAPPFRGRAAEMFVATKLHIRRRSLQTVTRRIDMDTFSPRYVRKNWSRMLLAVASLPATDPLFVAETNPNLAGLETAALRMPDALIKENVDGTDDLPHKFVSRAVSHTLSLATSITRDPADGTSALVPQRTGWGG